MQPLNKIFAQWFEAVTWAAGITGLAILDPGGETHFSLCIFNWLGISFCPGCGLGHSISWLLHGDPVRSLQAHPLGIFAMIILIYRIFKLTKTNLTTKLKPT